MKPYEKFEKLITSVLELLKSSNDNVVTNFKVTDPDNPSRLRQVDIAITNANFITHVECRLHEKPQDVKWIEELIGRKISLQANSMIAVSSSGFTEGAIKKAARYDIELRDLMTLSKDDVLKWGKFRQFEARYLLFNKPTIVLIVNPISYLSEIGDQEISALFDLEKIIEFAFGPLANYVSDSSADTEKLQAGKKSDVYLVVDVEKETLVKGMPLISVSLNVHMKWETVMHYVSESKLYGRPADESDRREAMIQQFEALDWTLIETEDKAKLDLDFSVLQHPANCYFLGGQFQNLSSKEHQIHIENKDKTIFLNAIEEVRFLLCWRDKIITL